MRTILSPPISLLLLLLLHLKAITTQYRPQYTYDLFDESTLVITANPRMSFYDFNITYHSPKINSRYYKSVNVTFSYYDKDKNSLLIREVTAKNLSLNYEYDEKAGVLSILLDEKTYYNDSSNHSLYIILDLFPYYEGVEYKVKANQKETYYWNVPFVCVLVVALLLILYCFYIGRIKCGNSGELDIITAMFDERIKYMKNM